VKQPSLAAALAALLVIAGLVAGLRAYAQSKLDHHFDQLALANFKSTRLGLSTDERVLQRADYLPVYGSCELVYPQRNRIDHFFASRPTGFRVAPNGDRGVTSLLIAERFAALGERLRGKRLIVILTPEWFFRPEANTPTYDGNFSVEHALAALTSTSLDPGIKRRMALRMADYPQTLEKNVFLSQLVSALCDPSPAHHAVLPVVDGLAGGYLGVERILDPIFTYAGFRREVSKLRVNLPAPKAQEIDWDHVFARGAKEFQKLSGDNPYGFRDTLWEKVEVKPRTYFYQTNDRSFVQRLRATKEWEDYELMLAVLKQYGAQPLVISAPINARYLEALGVSSAAWANYYGEMHKIAGEYHVPVVDFKKFEDDPEFFGFADPNPKGWIYINRVADAFYHGHLGNFKRTL
jgi:D-alanine transfer protein